MDTVVHLKGGLCSLITLNVLRLDLAAIERNLLRKKQEAPALFNRLPCAINLADLEPEQLDLVHLHHICRQAGLLPIAVRNAAPVWQPLLEQLELADLGRTLDRMNKTPAQAPAKMKVLHHTVRSGQQVHHDGDLTIFGTVSFGAEVLASGSIHIFGRLLGRALAGIKGDEQAVICAQQFDAELVAIAGQYKLFDEAHEFKNRAVSIQLDDTRLNITALS